MSDREEKTPVDQLNEALDELGIAGIIWSQFWFDGMQLEPQMIVSKDGGSARVYPGNEMFATVDEDNYGVFAFVLGGTAAFSVGDLVLEGGELEIDRVVAAYGYPLTDGQKEVVGLLMKGEVLDWTEYPATSVSDRVRPKVKLSIDEKTFQEIIDHVEQLDETDYLYSILEKLNSLGAATPIDPLPFPDPGLIPLKELDFEDLAGLLQNADEESTVRVFRLGTISDDQLRLMVRDFPRGYHHEWASVDWDVFVDKSAKLLTMRTNLGLKEPATVSQLEERINAFHAMSIDSTARITVDLVRLDKLSISVEKKIPLDAGLDVGYCASSFAEIAGFIGWNTEFKEFFEDLVEVSG